MIQILGLMDMYFDAVVVEVKTFLLLIRLAQAILCYVLLHCFSDQLRKAFKGVRNEIPLDAVNSYKAILGSALEQGNYFKRFSLLLHCEELQMELDIRNYDMEVSKF